jgi:ATP-dependent DNA helicase RecG
VTGFSESVVERDVPPWLGSIAWTVRNGAEAALRENSTEHRLIEQLPVIARIVPRRMEHGGTPLLPVEALREVLFCEHESKPWKPRIARNFYQRGIIETWGRGTLKIARLMQEAGHQPPTVFLRPGAVVVTFGLPKTNAPETAGETPQRMTQKTPQKLPDAIVELLRSKPELSFAQMAPLLSKSESTIERAIGKLKASGRLERIGSDKGGHWKVIE